MRLPSKPFNMTRESRKLNKRDGMFICTKGAVIGVFKKRLLNEDIKANCEQDFRNNIVMRPNIRVNMSVVAQWDDGGDKDNDWKYQDDSARDCISWEEDVVKNAEYFN
ncbi:hypothetical protein VE02_08354 [Pseudogymnoascus sp. 03VT05]|nr:hypothetical protein VE02_08354 [Pseudogymnoascus sp. 03VT05]